VAFHPSSEVAERAYELIHADRDGELTEEERKELESYLVIEHLMELIKLGNCSDLTSLINSSYDGRRSESTAQGKPGTA
jgi:hypothetical protein